MIGRAFGVLPSDKSIRALSPFQTLWIYTHIKKEQAEERKFQTELVKVLSYMINPTSAKKVFDPKPGPSIENGVEREDINISENAFIAQLKAMDPSFNVASYKAVTESLDG